MSVRRRPTANFCTQNMLRTEPDNKPGECRQLVAKKVGLSKFFEHVDRYSSREESTSESVVSFYDADDLLVAQMVWNPNEVGAAYCEHRVFLRE